MGLWGCAILRLWSRRSNNKAWRLKIEAWLSENEKEKRAGEDLQRRARQLQANRRSFEDSESENKVANAEDSSMNEDFSRSEAYDWRPSVEKTDVIRTMEAVEGYHTAFFCLFLGVAGCYHLWGAFILWKGGSMM